LHYVPAAAGFYFPAPQGKREIGSFGSSAQAAALATSFGRWEQSRANTASLIIDIVTIEVYIAFIVDIRGVILIVAGRPEPPPRPV